MADAVTTHMAATTKDGRYGNPGDVQEELSACFS